MQRSSSPLRSPAALLGMGAGLGYLAWRSVTHPAVDLTDRVVLITGGSRGLGFLMAQEFARHGCRVAICARDERQLERAQADLARIDRRVLALRCDVSDPDAVTAMVGRVTEHFHRIDVLVNNAGIIQVGPLTSMTIADYRQAMDVIFWGSVHCTLAVLPQMMERRDGRIVNITSIGGKVAVPHLLPYDAAKFALVGLSEGWRAELKGHGIRVTTVVPGLMRTGSPTNAFFKGDAAKEFTWFALASATPASTMSARRAARRIVEATGRGESEVTLTWQAKALRVAQGLFPGAVADLLGAVNRLLPKGDARSEYRGMHLASRLAPSPLTTLMTRAAVRNNEFGGFPTPSPRHARQSGLHER
jgi:NAD(P)-dependent dehydrogenase (short-subunit alcohol dehydrogenase family)